MTQPIASANSSLCSVQCGTTTLCHDGTLAFLQQIPVFVSIGTLQTVDDGCLTPWENPNLKTRLPFDKTHIH